MSRRPIRYVVVATSDGTPTDVFGPYQEYETATREARRLSAVFTKENEEMVADAIATHWEAGPFSGSVPVDLGVRVLPIEGGPIRVREVVR